MKSCKELLAENRAWAEAVFSRIDKKMKILTVKNRDRIVDGINENGGRKDISITAWTSGFWGATNVLMFRQTKNEEYLTTAKRSEELLDKAFMTHERLTHDVGFQWHILSGAIYDLTGDEESKRRNLLSACLLSSRYVMNGRFIRAWNGDWRGLKTQNFTIIDCMMNIPQLYWASRVTGDDRFKQIAMSHADTVMGTHVRPDGSVAHIVEHDRETATMVKTYAGQGYEVGSSWSRGQTWALYGFVLSYIHTGEVKYLDTAKRVAHYFIANCCDDWLPRLDFRAPSEPVYYDSTAGACAACGLIEIAKAVGENEGGMYMNAAINILKAMEEKFTSYDEDTEYILGYGSSSYPFTPKEVEERVHWPIIYGDYYFIEAITKLLGSDYVC